LLPGALGNEDSSINESFSENVFQAGEAAASTSHQSPFVSAQGKPVTSHVLLDFPHYTRPAEFRGWPVPEILLGGNHEEIRRWRREKALEKTKRNRPDLLGAE
jgi:tRNA (guanine37-N1)-methyltransferase